MSTALFETASLIDAVRKAARFAPTKGAELDKAGGILIELSMPVDTPVATIRSTDLSVFFRQTLRPLEMTLDRETWRVSSELFEAIISRLPMGMGSTVGLWDDDQGALHIECGTVKAKLHLYDEAVDFPQWAAFDPSGMEVSTGFAQRVSQVKWATDKKADNVLSGVHIDGEYLWATDRHCAVRVPLACPVGRPVTVPLAELTELVRDHPEVALRAAEDALEVAPDADTQVRVVLLTGQYPSLAAFMGSAMANTVPVEKGVLVGAIERLVVLDPSDRFPLMRMFFEGDQLQLKREVQGIGWINEDITLSAPVEEPFELWVTPTMLRNILMHCAGTVIEFSYGEIATAPFSVRDDAGFLAVGLPRRPSSL